MLNEAMLFESRDLSVPRHDPIIDVKPWGSTLVPLAVRHRVDDGVGWSGASIVGASRRRALPTGT